MRIIRSTVTLPLSPIITSGSVSIPLSLSDARFAANVAGVAGVSFQTGTISNTTWNDSPTYPHGDQCCSWNAVSGTATLFQCSVDWREGPRIANDVGTLNVDQCFINCIGFIGDHADGMQAFSPGGVGTLNVTNTCFRSYSDTEAVATYGASAVSSEALFWADSYQGTVNFTNVLVWGGRSGVAIYADVGTTTVNFTNVYFVLGTGDSSWESFIYDIRATGGTLVVGTWNNVCNATIVGNTIIPGSQLPSP